MFFEGAEVGGGDFGEELFGVFAGNLVLDHVAHVEKTGMFACPFVAFAVALARVLQGHVVTGEWAHLGTGGNMSIVEGRPFVFEMTRRS